MPDQALGPIAIAQAPGITPPRRLVASVTQACSRRCRSTTIFITPAFAQAAGASSDMTTTVIQFLPFVAVIFIMYFMVLRPQQKRARDQAELIKNIRRGDTIVTSGGIIAKVTKATEPSEIEVEIAPNVRIRVARQMVTEVRAKGEPVKDAG